MAGVHLRFVPVEADSNAAAEDDGGGSFSERASRQTHSPCARKQDESTLPLKERGSWYMTCTCDAGAGEIPEVGIRDEVTVPLDEGSRRKT